MLTWQGFVIVAAAMLTDQLINARIYDMNETCAYYPNGFIANDLNCGDYGYCQNGVLVGTGSCNAGFHYDKYQGICTNSGNSKTCGFTVADMCKDAKTAQYIPDPSACNRYCFCNGAGASNGCKDCPKYQIYNPKIEECIWEDSTTTGVCSAESICRLLPNGAIAGDPNDCTAYVGCKDGIGIPENCPTNYMFDAAQVLCVPTTGQCTSQGPKEGQECVNEQDADEDNPVFLPDNTCYGYYVCTGSNKASQHGKCPFATHFNPDTGTTGNPSCVTPYTYDCPNDRCGNLNLMFVTDVSEPNCNNYFYCVNSTQYDTPSQACPTSFPYYDEYNGICTSTKPTYAICA